MKRLCSVLILGWLVVFIVSPLFHTLEAEEKQVRIEGFAFRPGEIVIPVGGTVVWFQKDGATHTVTAEEGSFNSGRLPKGERFSHTFSQKGTFDYICEFHPSMRGKVTVK